MVYFRRISICQFDQYVNPKNEKKSRTGNCVAAQNINAGGIQREVSGRRIKKAKKQMKGYIQDRDSQNQASREAPPCNPIVTMATGNPAAMFCRKSPSLTINNTHSPPLWPPSAIYMLPTAFHNYDKRFLALISNNDAVANVLFYNSHFTRFVLILL